MFLQIIYILEDFKAEYIMDCLNNNKTRQSKKWATDLKIYRWQKKNHAMVHGH